MLDAIVGDTKINEISWGADSVLEAENKYRITVIIIMQKRKSTSREEQKNKWFIPNERWLDKTWPIEKLSTGEGVKDIPDQASSFGL